MVYYHINPETGRINICKATKSPCKYKKSNGEVVDHYFTRDEAQKAYDLINKDNVLVNYTKKRKVNQVYSSKNKIVVDDDLIGSPDTDSARLSFGKVSHGLLEDVSQIWFNDTQGSPMGFIQIIERKYEDNNVIELCDIEIRPEYRGHKLGSRLINAVGDLLGKEVVHHGGYTPDGFKSIAPLFHNEESLKVMEPDFNEMNFVNDWNTRTSKFNV